MLWVGMQASQLLKHLLRHLQGLGLFEPLFGSNIYDEIRRFNRLAWGYVDSARPRGVLAAGMENGELGIWDPTKILAGAEYVVIRIFVMRLLIHFQCN